MARLVDRTAYYVARRAHTLETIRQARACGLHGLVKAAQRDLAKLRRHAHGVASPKRLDRRPD